MGLGNLSPSDNSDDENRPTKRKYAEFSVDEFFRFLQDMPGEWEHVDNARTNEFVYETHDFAEGWNGLTLRVYSTVDKSTGMTRGKGEDAIRLVVWDRHTNKPVTGKKKTLRIQTWEKNLSKKIKEYMEQPEEHISKCPECSELMLVKEGQYGKFLGCQRWPDCDGTKEIE